MASKASLLMVTSLVICSGLCQVAASIPKGEYKSFVTNDDLTVVFTYAKMTTGKKEFLKEYEKIASEVKPLIPNIKFGHFEIQVDYSKSERIPLTMLPATIKLYQKGKLIYKTILHSFKPAEEMEIVRHRLVMLVTDPKKIQTLVKEKPTYLLILPKNTDKFLRHFITTVKDIKHSNFIYSFDESLVKLKIDHHKKLKLFYITKERSKKKFILFDEINKEAVYEFIIENLDVSAKYLTHQFLDTTFTEKKDSIVIFTDDKNSENLNHFFEASKSYSDSVMSVNPIQFVVADKTKGLGNLLSKFFSIHQLIENQAVIVEASDPEHPLYLCDLNSAKVILRCIDDWRKEKLKPINVSTENSAEDKIIINSINFKTFEKKVNQNPKNVIVFINGESSIRMKLIEVMFKNVANRFRNKQSIEFFEMNGEENQVSVLSKAPIPSIAIFTTTSKTNPSIFASKFSSRNLAHFIEKETGVMANAHTIPFEEPFEFDIGTSEAGLEEEILDDLISYDEKHIPYGQPDSTTVQDKNIGYIDDEL